MRDGRTGTRAALAAAAWLLCPTSPATGEAVNEAYIRSMAAPEGSVLVVEYRDGNGGVTDRRGFASRSGFRPRSPTQIRINESLAIRLHGIEPCQGEMVNEKEGYAGPCHDYARHGLEVLLRAPSVIFCRALAREAGARLQNASCHGYYSYPGAADTIAMFEEQLVSLGIHRIVRTPDGTALRADLEAAERIGRTGFGMWADPTISAR